MPCGEVWLPSREILLHPTWVAHAAIADALALWWDARRQWPPTPPVDAWQVAFDTAATGSDTPRVSTHESTTAGIIAEK